MARISDVVTCIQSDSNYMENIPTLLSNEIEAVLMSSRTLFVTLGHMLQF